MIGPLDDEEYSPETFRLRKSDHVAPETWSVSTSYSGHRILWRDYFSGTPQQQRPPQIVYNLLPQLAASLIVDLLPPYNSAICCFSERDVGHISPRLSITWTSDSLFRILRLWDWKFYILLNKLNFSMDIHQHLLLKYSCGKSASI